MLQLDQSRVETLPEFSQPFVEVQTEALGLSAYEVEQLITVPLEADLLNGVAFVEEIQSQSIPGLSSIVMTFEPGTNILDARQLVQERLTQAAGLPNVSRPPAMVQPLSSESRLMMIGLTSDELSLIDLGVLARWTIRPRLMGVDGVANVAVWGQREQQLQVQVDLDRLTAEKVPMTAIVNTAGNALWVTPLTFLEASTPGVGGFIDGPNQRIGIRHVPAISNAEDLASVVIDGRPDLVLGDVATVVQDHQPLIGDAVVGDTAGVYLVVEKFPWSNTAQTTAQVEAALAELEPGLTGVVVEPDLFRPATYIERATDNVLLVAILAMILVALAMFLLLGGWRTAVVASISVIVSIMAAASVVMLAGLTFNSMVFAGLAIGTLLIIDNTIRNVTAAAEQVDNGAVGLGRSIGSHAGSLTYAVVVLIVMMVPALFMEGAAGEFVPPIAYSMALALVAALIVAVLITPALISVIVDRTPTPSPVVARVGRSFDAVLDKALAAPKLAVAAAVVLVILGAGLTIPVDRDFVPAFRQTDLLISFDGAPGLSLQETRRVASEAAQELTALPGVEQAGTQVGRAILSDEVSNVNTSVIWVTVDPSADYDKTIDSVREVVDGYPGFDRPTINSYANDRVDDRLRNPGDDLVVRVYGEQPEQLNSLTRELVDVVGGVNGVENARALYPPVEPSFEIEVDLDAAAAAGIKPGDVRRAAATVFSGIEVGSLFEDQRVFEVIVWSEPRYRESISSLENFLIDTPSGDQVTLSSVADITVAPNERIIERDAVSRYIDIVADVPGRNITDVEDEIRGLVATRGLPYEFHVGFVGDTAKATSDFRQVVAVGIASVITILLLLQAAFSSWRMAAIVAVAAVAGLSGSIVAVLIAGGTYSIGTMAGMIVVVGLTLRTAFGLLKRYEALQLDEVETLGPDLVRSGAGQQFRLTFVSSVAIVLATLPVVFFGASAGLEVIRPLAIAVLGGVVTSTALTLLVIPAAYLWLGRPAATRELFGTPDDDAKPLVDLASD